MWESGGGLGWNFGLRSGRWKEEEEWKWNFGVEERNEGLVWEWNLTMVTIHGEWDFGVESWSGRTECGFGLGWSGHLEVKNPHDRLRWESRSFTSC
jgi:hypothetical protein